MSLLDFMFKKIQYYNFPVETYVCLFFGVCATMLDGGGSTFFTQLPTDRYIVCMGLCTLIIDQMMIEQNKVYTT